MAAIQQWGVTPPVSMTFPTEADIAINDALVEELKTQNNFERPEETKKRYTSICDLFLISNDDADCVRFRTTVLESLQRITTEFVLQVSKRKGLGDAVAGSAGGKIFTYGSYRLGVYGPGEADFLPDCRRLGPSERSVTWNLT
jgi:poly(A) polymerase